MTPFALLTVICAAALLVRVACIAGDQGLHRWEGQEVRCLAMAVSYACIGVGAFIVGCVAALMPLEPIGQHGTPMLLLGIVIRIFVDRRWQ